MNPCLSIKESSQDSWTWKPTTDLKLTIFQEKYLPLKQMTAWCRQFLPKIIEQDSAEFLIYLQGLIL